MPEMFKTTLHNVQKKKKKMHLTENKMGEFAK